MAQISAACCIHAQQERKGSRVAVNYGKGGISVSGYYVGQIEFERPGPIANDPLNRAVHLEPGSNCYVETDTNTGKSLVPMPSQLPSPFSVEVWAQNEGGSHTTRYVVMTGRYVSHLDSSNSQHNLAGLPFRNTDAFTFPALAGMLSYAPGKIYGLQQFTQMTVMS